MGLGNINISLSKTRNKAATLSIPILEEFEEIEPTEFHTIENLQQQVNDQKERINKFEEKKVKGKPRSPIISALTEDYPIERIKSNNKAPEYISLDMENDQIAKEEEEDDGFFDQDEGMLDDGRLALTEREINIQKKLHDMNIEEAIYEA